MIHTNVKLGDGGERAQTDVGSPMRVIASWSADGKRILFTVSDGTKGMPKGMLYSIKANGTDLRPLGVEANIGRWSPNGKHLAYIKGRSPNIAIFVANADGSGAKMIVP